MGEGPNIPADADERRLYEQAMRLGVTLGGRPAHAWVPMLGADCQHGTYCPWGDACDGWGDDDD